MFKILPLGIKGSYYSYTQKWAQMCLLCVLACECHGKGSLSGVCHLETGVCDCKPHVTGQQCDRCSVRGLLVIAYN